MPPEKLAGFDGGQELPDCGRGPIQYFYQARNSAALVSFGERPYEPRVHMNLIRRDKHQDGCAAMVPKRAVKLGRLRTLNFLNQFEVNEGNVLRAEHAIKVQQI